ncbi:hypothetical protein QYE76_029462 [Lolium multiflorum]|uniref:Uncharacterized protein n=1 Tax=Lolium multiflorum TaxID=4521 RepID=A0AAD8QR72_LOLMU|nr:hypothetical protein QYE76_029462 [Lolium multiflorum]
MADGTPVTYEDLTEELKKKYDEVKAIVEADLIGSFHRTLTWHRVERVLTGDRDQLSGLTKERCQSRPPLPFALAAPNSPAYIVYKIGGDPSDYRFLHDKEIPHGYTCTYVPLPMWTLTNHTGTGTTGGTSGTDLEKQTWLAKYATPKNLQSSAPAVGSKLEKQAWLAKYATRRIFEFDSCQPGSDQYHPERPVRHGAEKEDNRLFQAVPNEYELIPLPPKYRLPDFSKFNGSDGSSSIEHVSRYLAQLGTISAADELRVRFFAQSLTGSAFGWYTSLPPRLNPDLEAVGRAVPHAVSLRGFRGWHCRSSTRFSFNINMVGLDTTLAETRAAALVARTRRPFHAIGSVTMASATSRGRRRKTIPTTFFIVDSKSTYDVLLGRDWIHANCCIPSTMHQCIIQWDGDEVEVVHADDSAEISTAGMNAAGQEPLSGINLDDCERIDVTKDGVRLVLSTGLTV